MSNRTKRREEARAQKKREEQYRKWREKNAFIGEHYNNIRRLVDEGKIRSMNDRSIDVELYYKQYTAKNKIIRLFFFCLRCIQFFWSKLWRR